MEPLKIKKADMQELPGWIVDLVAVIRPHIDAATDFVCKEVDPNIGKSLKDDQYSVTHCNAKCAKTLTFATDGRWEDVNKQRYKDGTVCDRVVRDYKYIVVENVVQNGQDAPKFTKTCIVRDKRLLLALRQAVGKHGW